VRAGQAGEKEVQYVLQWLDDRHKVINSVFLRGPNYDAQQFDHLVVGPFGVLNLETKNYSGTLRIDAHGTWTQQTAPHRTPQRITSPAFQVQRHRAVLQDILPENMPIHDIIVIANNGTIVEGRENCPVPVVTSDMLLSSIEKLGEYHILSDSQIEETYQEITKHVVSGP